MARRNAPTLPERRITAPMGQSVSVSECESVSVPAYEGASENESPPLSHSPTLAPSHPPTRPPADLAQQIRAQLAELPPAGYRPRHIDIQLRDPPLAEFLAKLFHGLNDADARLRTGKHVTSVNDAVRWLLEQCQLACTSHVVIPQVAADDSPAQD